MNDAVLYEAATAEHPVGLLRLNRPDQRNSMTPELLDAYHHIIDQVRANTSARAVILTGSGSCFSAGADLRSQVQRSNVGAPKMPHEASFAMYVPFLRTLEIEVPVIGALNGHAVGGGFGLSLLCDLRIGTHKAKYGANFARLGLHSGLAISYTLPKVVGPGRAAELLFSGRLMDGDEAAQSGYLTRVVAAEDVLPVARLVAAEIAKSAPVAVRMMKASLRQNTGLTPGAIREAAWSEAYAQSATVATADFQEGARALLEKRDPRFEGR